MSMPRPLVAPSKALLRWGRASEGSSTLSLIRCPSQLTVTVIGPSGQWRHPCTTALAMSSWALRAKSSAM